MERIAIDPKVDGNFRVLAVLNSDKIAGEIKVELYDINGQKIASEFETDIKKGVKEVWVKGKIEGIKSWNPEDPNLYDMKVALMKDGKEIHSELKRIGFRTIELRKRDGFYVNGNKVVFKGVNRHSFWPETGRALSDANHKMDIRLMKEMNMNSVRMSHYCHHQKNYVFLAWTH